MIVEARAWRRGGLARAWLFLLVLGQLFTNHPLLRLSGGEAALQWHHLVGAAGVAVGLLRARRLRVPVNAFTGLCAYALALTALLAPRYGISARAVNLLYSAAIYLAVYGLRDRLGAKEVERVMRAAGGIYLILVIGNTLRGLPSVIDCVLGRRAHPALASWIGGGVNIESSYLAIFSLFFLRARKDWYWALALVISALYGSRTGLLLDALALLLALAARSRALRPRALLSGALLTAALAAFAWGLYRAGLLNNVLRRFARIGSEGGSLGRMRLWRTAPRMLAENPLGCGFGNAIGLARTYAGVDFAEGNLHNVYLQYLAELGLPGLMLLAASLARAAASAWRLRFRDPVRGAILLFGAGFLVQFVGTEPLFFALMALFHADEAARRAARDSRRGEGDG